jgi:ribosome-binding factor A
VSHRVERFASTLKQVLADILLNEVNDPHLRSATITDVIVSPDLRKARVFITDATGTDSEHNNTSELLERLEHAKGFIKKTLGQRMYLKYIPQLSFHRDEIIAPLRIHSSIDGNE